MVNRRLFSSFLLLTLVASFLAACSGGKSATAPSNSASPGGSPAAKKPRVALIVDQRQGDQGPIDSMVGGVRRAEKDFGIEAKIVESVQSAEHEDNIRAMARAGYDLVLVSFHTMIEPMKKVAPEFPKTQFAIIFGSMDADLEKLSNVRVVDFRTYDVYYLAGAVAGMMSRTGKLGYVAGTDIPILNANYNAFLEGAKTQRPDTKIELVYANSFEDPAKGKEITLGFAGKGIDVVGADAGMTTLGVIEAAKSKGIFVVGDSVDHGQREPATVLVSAMARFDNTAYNQIKDFTDQKFKGGLAWSNLENQGVLLSQMETFKKSGPADLAGKVDKAVELTKKLQAEIQSGKLQVPIVTTVSK